MRSRSNGNFCKLSALDAASGWRTNAARAAMRENFSTRRRPLAFVETEGNYIARQNRDCEARYGSRTKRGKVPGLRGERGKNCNGALFIQERVLSSPLSCRCDSLEMFRCEFPCRTSRMDSQTRVRAYVQCVAVYTRSFINPADYFQNGERYFLTRPRLVRVGRPTVNMMLLASRLPRESEELLFHY